MTDRTKEALRDLLLWAVGSDKTGNPYRFAEVKEGFQAFGLDPFAAGSTEKLRKGETPDEEGRYNGWKNYETWVTALWIDNEQGTYDTAREMGEQVKEDAETSSQVLEGIWTLEEARRFNLADALKDWQEEEMPELEASVWSDLLRAAFQEVDWYEIADHYLEEMS